MLERPHTDLRAGLTGGFIALVDQESRRPMRIIAGQSGESADSVFGNVHPAPCCGDIGFLWTKDGPPVPRRSGLNTGLVVCPGLHGGVVF